LGGGHGRVDVIPAIGKRLLSYPINVLGKLARSYFAGPTTTGESLVFSERMRKLVERFAEPLRYDAILVDARAGLHETTAAAVLGLGAEVLFFGQDQPQTYAGYELLFAHLGTIPRGESEDWQERIHIVQSKSPVNPAQRTKFVDRMSSLVSKYLSRYRDVLDVEIDTTSLRETFYVEWSEDNSNAVETILEEETVSILAVLEDERFRVFDPISDHDVLAAPTYSDSFSEILALTETVLAGFAERGQ
jgi:hypothetical protein